MFDADLKTLGDEVVVVSNPRLEILFLSAKLSLYSFSLLGDTAFNTEIHHIDPSTKAIWYLGLETAVRLAHMYSQIATINTNPSTLTPTQNSPHYAFPKHHFWILIASGYYLLKFLSINTLTTPSESELARNTIRLVYSTLQSWSRASQDEPSRVARIISLLANSELQGTLAEFKRLNRRPPLSIIADVMEMTAWLRAKLKREGAGRAAMSTSELNGEKDGARDAGEELQMPVVGVGEPVLLDDEALWEGLDEWLRLEGGLGNLLLPYPDGEFVGG